MENLGKGGGGERKGKMGKGRGGMGIGTTRGALPILGKFESWSGELEPAEEGLAIFENEGSLFLCKERRRGCKKE